MPVQYKIGALGGGSWSPAIASGRVAYKRPNTSTWSYPSGVFVKVGDIGGGVWRDTDYKGYPAIPTTPTIYAWDYSDMRISWAAGSGGAPVANYTVRVTGSGGNPDTSYLHSSDHTGSPTGNIGVSWDSKYKVYVRANSAGGLSSAWSPVLQPWIGHPRQDTYGYVQRTRAWSTTLSGGVWWKDRYDGNAGGTVVWVPDSVYVQYYRHYLYSNNHFTDILSPFNQRYISYYQASIDQNVSLNWNTWHYTTTTGPYWANGGNGWWGPVCHGSGWATSASTVAHMRGDFGIDGIEYYNNYEITSTIYEQGNQYW